MLNVQGVSTAIKQFRVFAMQLPVSLQRPGYAEIIKALFIWQLANN
jgi:hypothetical protein